MKLYFNKRYNGQMLAHLDIAVVVFPVFRFCREQSNSIRGSLGRRALSQQKKFAAVELRK